MISVELNQSDIMELTLRKLLMVIVPLIHMVQKPETLLIALLRRLNTLLFKV